jgi:hypothetical protein
MNGAAKNWIVRYRRKGCVLTKVRCSIASIALLAFLASASDEQPFRAKPASEYAHQDSEQVLVGAKAFDNEDLTAEAFGKKLDLLRYGILPVLVVIENKRNTAINVEHMQVELVAADGRHGSAVAPEDLIHLAEQGRKPPKIGAGPLPFPTPRKKNPLNAPELVMRAFSAKVVPPGDSASGFFYFEARPESGDSIYLNGMQDARSRKDLLYIEFPLNPR